MANVSDNAPGAQAIDQLEDLRDRPGLLKQIGTFARKQPLGFAGLLVVILFIVLAVFAPDASAEEVERLSTTGLPVVSDAAPSDIDR